MTTLREIRKFVERIAKEFRPQKIILFGSYAYGQPRDSSDVDLLVVMRHRGPPAYKSVEIELKIRPPFALDLLVRSPAKIRERLRLGD
ncbi:MAG: nucleotidyltransferase domain-containing protein [Planctomycetota bacterium]